MNDDRENRPDDEGTINDPASEAPESPRTLKLTLRKTQGGRIVKESVASSDIESAPSPMSRKDIAGTQTTVLPRIYPISPADETVDTPADAERQPERSLRFDDDDDEASVESAKPEPGGNSDCSVGAPSDQRASRPVEKETRDVDRRPRLQVRSKTVPPGTEDEPDRDEMKRRQRKNRRSQGMHRVSASMALLLIFVGNALTAMPAWRSGIQARTLPIQELLMLGGVVLVMALLLFSSRMPLRILGGMLIMLMICAGLFVAFYGYIPSSWNLTIPPDTLAQFGRPVIMLAASLFFLAAFTFNTGGRAAQWIVSAIFIVTGIALPLLPETVLATIGCGGTVAVPGIDPAEDFDRWNRLSMTSSMGFWKSADGTVECRVRVWNAEEFESLDAFVDYRRNELEEDGFGSPAMFPVFGRQHQIQATLFNPDQRVELLAVKDEKHYYSVEFKMNRGAYPEHRAFIKDLFGAVP